MNAPDITLLEFLREADLAKADETGDWAALSGGVSSDIWRVETSRGLFCVKRALAQLKVAATWLAPVNRNAYEWQYICVAHAIAAGAVPKPVAHDEKRGAFAMEWLSPELHPVWKNELLERRIDPNFAAQVGDLLGRIHAASAADPRLQAQFASDENFHALRIEPYLLATAAKHPDLAPTLERIASITATTKRALVHGDVSPKNILAGPDGPIFLDAECAWFGDPAFDLAFCLNHLLIKSRHLGADAGRGLLESFSRLSQAYQLRVDWESYDDLETRAAALLPALALARVDGKSPVEYLEDTARSDLRDAARRAMALQPTRLAQAASLLLNPA